MSRELTNGATGVRFVGKIIAMPFVLIWILLDLDRTVVIEERVNLWTDGTF